MNKKTYAKGLTNGIIAFTLWGLLPLYWKSVSAINPYQVFAQRVVWSLIFVLLILWIKKDLKRFISMLKKKRNWTMTLGPALFISINWLVYIYAVNSGYVLQASLGYYINPLVLTLFGSIFFKERLNRLQKIGIGFASLGVIIKTLMYGSLPIYALILAVSFAIYGLLKKKSELDSLTGLAFETIIVGIPTFIYLIIVESSGLGIIGNLNWTFWLLISMSGVLTATPLILYANGTKTLPLTVIAFLQYIAPTIGLFLGIFVFKESFVLLDLVPFVLIWIGLGFFTYSQVRLFKESNV